MTLTQGPLPPPKHLTKPEHIALWYGAQRTIFENCAKRPPVLPRHLSLVYVGSEAERKVAS